MAKDEWFEFKRDRHGRKCLVVHKGRPQLCGNEQAANGQVQQVKNEEKSNESKKTAEAANGQVQQVKNEEKPKESKQTAEAKAAKPQEAISKQSKEADFTRAEDNILKALKVANRTWEQISEDMNRPVGALKARYREVMKIDALEKARATKQNTKRNDAKQSEAVKKDQVKAVKAAHEAKQSEAVRKDQVKAVKATHDRKDQEHHKAHEKRSKPAEDKHKTRNESKKPTTEKHVSFEQRRERWLDKHSNILDSFFDPGELFCINDIINNYTDYKWTRIADAFFDETGRRVQPDEIRTRFEKYKKK